MLIILPQFEMNKMNAVLKSILPISSGHDVFKTSSGHFKKVTPSYDQARRRQDVWKKTSDLRRLQDVQFTTSWRCLTYDVLRTSDLQHLEDIRFTSSSRRLTYDVLRMSDLRRLWRCPIYDIFKTSVKGCLCSNVVLISIQRQKKCFFLILYCLKYSENFKCSCLG